MISHQTKKNYDPLSKNSANPLSNEIVVMLVMLKCRQQRLKEIARTQHEKILKGDKKREI
jgi:hypothetical protein